MTNISDLSYKERFAVLEEMITDLEVRGYPMSGPLRALRAGEDGVSFMKVFHVAKLDPEYSEKWRTELAAFNEHFSKDAYMRHCGYPLS